LLVTHPECF
jgi:hypothetical protein